MNIPKLVELLSNYSPTLDWYLGKPSIASPLEIYVDNVSIDEICFLNKALEPKITLLLKLLLSRLFQLSMFAVSYYFVSDFVFFNFSFRMMESKRIRKFRLCLRQVVPVFA